MGIKNNRKRLAAAAIAIVGLASGAVAAHAATLWQRVTSATSPISFPAIAPTCTTASCLVTLDAGTGSVIVPDEVNGPQTVPFYGFNVNGQGLGEHTLAGGATSTIKVPFGTTLQITLTGIPIDLSFPSLPAGDVSHVGNVYTVHATKVGTSVFQPGKNVDAPRQIAMGLVGVLIVTPTDCTGVNLTCAYDGTSYADEALVATTDLDFDFANGVSTFPGMGYFGQPVNPDGSARKVYHVINGKSFPDTDVIDVRAGDSVLLRTVNAGVTDKSMSLLGLRQKLLARNASKYTDPQTFVAPLVGPGETADLVVEIPALTPANQRFALIDAGRQMNNGNQYGFGGALTFLNVWPANQAVSPSVSASYAWTTQQLGGTATPADPAYPVTAVDYSTDNVSFINLVANPLGITTFSGTVAMSTPGTVYVRVTDINGQQGTTTASAAPALPIAVSPTASSPDGLIQAIATADTNLTVTAGEYFVGAAGAEGAGSAMTVSGTGPYTLNATRLSIVAGDTISIRVKDNVGHWSTAIQTTVVAKAMPTVGGPTADTGTGVIAATATADIGLTVTAAEYFVGATDPGLGVATLMTVTGGPTTFTLAATALNPLVNTDVVSIRAMDNFGRWGPITTVTPVP